MREEILKAVKKAYPGIKISLKDIELEHPAVEEHGDYSTNIALKLAKKLGGKKSFLENIDWIVRTINKNNFEDYKEPVPVGKLLADVQKIIGTKNELVYLKPRIYAKWCGWWREHRGHEEILPFLSYLPSICFSPLGVYKDRGDTGRFLLSFGIGHFGMLVIEILEEKNRNEIVTAFYFDKLRLGEYEEILDLEKSSLGKLRPASLLAPHLNGGVAGAISSLQESQGFYNTLDLKSQEEILFYEEKLNPQEVAEKIVVQLHKTTSCEAKQGFINFWLSEEELIKKMEANLENIPLNGKKIVIELVSPNINKPLHIGHLRNAALGMALSNIYKVNGWEVVRDEINNDRGLHIMKAAYGYLLFGQKKAVETKEWKELLSLWISDPGKWKTPKTEKKKPDFFVGEFYVLGEKYLMENEKFAGEQLAQMLQSWEAEEKYIWQLWKIMSDWVHEGIDQTYKRIGVEHDKKWYEHLLYKEGKEYILEAVNKGILEKLPDGAIQANLGKYSLENKILVRRDGTAIYMTFDIALTKHKVEEFKANKYVWIVGNDQIDHFKRLFAIFEMLGLGKRENFYHLAYGMVRVPGGKMSSRLGNVILADNLLDKVKEMAEKFGKETAEKVALGAVKYAMLKVNPLMDVVFDLEKSVSLEGDSGPYLQYTYARARSVIRKSESQKTQIARPSDKSDFQSSLSSPEEIAILRFLYRFPEVVEQAAKQYAPNLICSYLFELAKRFNNFYNNCPILENPFRLTLTASCADILKTGLNLLGIEVLERM